MRDVEIPNWLKGLPLAPEFRPTDTEFADPIAYISKIEKEASAFGICKVIPPLPKPSKKYVLHNLNKSLSKCPELGSDVNVCSTLKTTDNGGEGSNNGGEFRAVFTTRHQELGNSGQRLKGVDGNQMLGAHKQVWQSGEVYTFEQFEAKAKNFAKSQLSMVKDVSPLVIEAIFWKAASEKPIYVEYANDVPGSGFGEPEGLFRYFHRRRRRRKRGTFDRNRQASSSCKDDQVDTVNSIGVDADSCSNNNSNLGKETSMDSCSLPSTSSDQSTLPSRRKCSNACTDMEGTAGWKLSNSPWNLQMIARSPGSLTRFMPDDIPGVTSPMVYIGMLFSWFAWHVEDHELHSLNFLHVGSPKTWYAVPGDYTFAFEEVIRHHAYGGNTDSLAALTLLGEKTTLLSPEVVVSSGIPCCRLVQNPGEFVVTFPRAYHVGFSHGFNCGEAANFGTPQWLQVAKEAAVRRAAMNYLPMLSHQQLLYLLTMSFVSRVPRSLLLGVRSSRRRDRQKEERERLVKKAFIEDIVKENKLLTPLLRKSSSYRVVEWDLESLPSSTKGTELCNSIETVAKTSIENDSGKADKLDLCTEMSLYMDTVYDVHEDDDDLLCDFRVDSGTLPCVACGILGFPFMAVVQPSEKASRDLQLKDHNATQNPGAFKRVEPHATLDFNCIVDASDPDKLNPVLKNILNDPDEAFSSAQSSQSTCSVAEDQLLVPDHSSSLKREAASAEVQLQKGWKNSNRFSRPRIFCLEHALQTEELLHARGGANVLVICHSDFRKIRAHVSVVAEEIGTPFNYEEIPFDNASHEDLNLIDLATDSEEQDECAADWTSKLNINLQHCMKLRKKFPSTKVQHALRLDGLLSVTNQSSNPLTLIWQSRKSRSKRCSKYPVQNKPSVSIQMEKHESVMEKSDSPVASKEDQIQIDKSESREAKPDCQIARKVNIIVQYSRRRYKSKPCVSTGVREASAGTNHLLSQELSGAGCERPDVKTSTMSESSPSLVASSREAALQLDCQIILPADDNNENPLQSLDADSLVATVPSIGITEAETGNLELEEFTMDDTVSNLTSHIPQMPQEIKAVEEDREKGHRGVFENSGGSPETAKRSSENCETIGVNPIQNETRVANSTSPLVADDLNIRSNKHADGDVLMDETSDASNSSMSSIDSHSLDNIDEQMGKTEKNNQGLDSELMDLSTSDGKGWQEIQTANGDYQYKALSRHAVLINGSTSDLVEDLEVPKERNASEDSQSEGGNCSLLEKIELDDSASTIVPSRTSAKSGRKRKREWELLAEAQISSNDFIRSPCEGLRPRIRKDTVLNETDCKKPVKAQEASKQAYDLVPHKDAKQHKKGSHRCDLESCRMSFQTKAELLLHKCNRCTYKGCGKKFSAHKYVILHQRVHVDDRPLKCPWKGCTMSFKWAWARTEHLRVHTGERPYKCKIDGCGRTFRFVSDYSRHRRKTGHYVD